MSFGDYKRMTERVIALWKRGDYAAALADARQAYALEVGELAEHGYSHAAWGLISVLTKLKRFDAARRIFAEAVEDTALFEARVKRDPQTAEKILVAGACIAWDSEDFAAQAKSMRRAYDRRSADGADLAYAFACYFARIEDHRVWEALEAAIAKGTPISHVLVDPDLESLHADRRWDHVVAKDRPWRIDSRPSGARIFLDDVDTGATTPARVKPQRETHRVRLVLDDYAEDEVEITASNQLSMERTLTPLEQIEKQRRIDAEAMREPSEASRASTRTFVGDIGRARIELCRHATYGLGSLGIEVRGDGRIKLGRGTFWPKEMPVEHETRADAAAVAGLFDAFVAAAFTEIEIADRPALPDELYFDLVLVGKGGKCKRGKFVGNPHPRFDRLVAAIFDFAVRAVEPTLHKALTLPIGRG